MPYTLSFSVRTRKGWDDITPDIAALMATANDMSKPDTERKAALDEARKQACECDTVWLNGTLADEAEMRQAVPEIAKRYARSGLILQTKIDTERKKLGIGIGLQGGMDLSTAP